MRKSLPRVLLLFVLAAVVGGCDDDGVTLPTPAPTTTDTFTGTLNPNGAANFPFVVSSVTGGLVTATLKALNPNTNAIGFSLGTWNGAVCAIVLDNQFAVQDAVLSARASTIASLCLRVYDPATNAPLPNNVDFSVEVEHP
jgi:hypothetical protein